MRRRELLKTVATAPLLALPAGHATPRLPRLTRVRPGTPGWPARSVWAELDAALGGNLIEVPPLLGACAAAADGAACAELTANLRNPFYLSDQPAGTEVSGWLDAWTPAASVYAVRARHSADVVAAVNFAREHRLRVAVKGTGHSYQGTSSAPDSLLIWTHALNTVTLHEAFVAEGCAGKAEPVPAVSSGAGAMWIDLYHAVTSQGGRYVQGGGCTSVGVAGLVQSGGFGSFSKGFGTAAAGLIEAEVVTADGQVRTVNACRHPDLYWALKGGGGGSFAVLTRLTLRTHALPEFFGAVWGKIRALSAPAFERLIARFVAFYAEHLVNPHWGEQAAIGARTLRLSLVCQGLSADAARAAWEPFFAFVKEAPGDYEIQEELGAGARAARDWWKLSGTHRMVKDPRPGVPEHHVWWQGDSEQVGAFLHGYDSLWLPARLLATAEQPHLVAALLAGGARQEIELHFNKGLAGATPEVLAGALDTATNPAVTEAFALAIIADGEAAAYPGLKRTPLDLAAAHANARDIAACAAELRKVAPQAGSYVSESNYFNADWRQAFWGRNYTRLRWIKDKYDPDGLFFVHHGVGSEDWSADGFTRL